MPPPTSVPSRRARRPRLRARNSTRSRRDWPTRRRAGSLGRLAGPGAAGSTRISTSIRRLRAAAEAALAEATRAYVVGADAVPTLAAERGSLVIAERAAGSGPEDARDRRYREAIAAAGGGTLDEAVRRDTTGVARRLLVRAAWLPDLERLSRHAGRHAAGLDRGDPRR